MRGLIKISIWPTFQSILQLIFKRRKMLYVCVHSIFEPIQLYFIMLSFIEGHYEIFPIIVASLQFLTYVISFILLIIFTNEIIKVQNYRKYPFFLLLLKIINLLVAGKVYFSHSKYIINASILLTLVCNFGIYTLFDKYPA